MTRTYGELSYWPPTGGQRRGKWAVTAHPEVMIKLKRLFPRVTTTRTDVVTVTDTTEVARDLEMLLYRYPMRVDGQTQARLDAQTKVHRDTETAVAAILTGAPPDRETAAWRTPARPAREYQSVAAALIHEVKRLIVTDALGLGKTTTGLLTLCDPAALPCLFVTLTHLPLQMQRELGKTWPDLTSHIIEKATPYDLRDHGDPDVVFISYSKLTKWRDHLAGRFRTVIFDEVQDLRRGQVSEKGKAAAHIAADAEYVVGLTATPVYNFGGEAHNLFDIVNPGALGTREEFLREWGSSERVTASGDRHIVVDNPKALSSYLRETGLMIGRTRHEVGRQLPYGEPVKVAHTVAADPAVLDRMSGDAIEMARLILDHTATNTDRWQAAGELDSRIRQATGLAKAPYVADVVKMLLETQERVVLWGWHHSVYDVWRERLAHARVRSVLYTGRQTPRLKDAAVRAFTLPLDDPWSARVLVMSLRAGAGIDGLQEFCSTGVFGELDWSPKVMDQCLGRLARDGQENEVTGYYLMSDHGADPTMSKILNLKERQARPFEDPDADVLAAVPAAGDRMKLLAADLLRRHHQPVPDLDDVPLPPPVPLL
jgi:hypothetical protein